MANELPAHAATYLRSLDKALWALSSDEREAVLAELRDHLGARAAEGDAALDSALADLGPVAALASAFDHGGRGRVAPLPAELADDRRKLSLTRVLGDVRATLRASRNGLTLVGALLVTVLTSSTFLLWMNVRMPWVGVAAAPVMLVRVAAVLIAFSAAYRLALSPRERPWSVDRSFLAFAGAFALASALAVILALVVGRAAGAAAAAAGMPAGAATGLRRGAALLALISGSVALLRVQPWLAALAARREGFSLRTSWEGTRGRMRTILKGWGTIVLPLYLLHSALNALALSALPFGGGSLALAMADAIVCAGIVIGAAMLNATVLRWIVREPIPAPSPFGTDAPDEAELDAAHARLRRLIRPAGPQPVRAE